MYKNRRNSGTVNSFLFVPTVVNDFKQTEAEEFIQRRFLFLDLLCPEKSLDNKLVSWAWAMFNMSLIR